MPEAQQTSCAVSTNANCQTCTGNNCNIDQVRKDEQCIVCNSAIDAKCSQQPEKISTDQCAVSSDGNCYERIVNGATMRGCAGNLTQTELTDCKLPNNCKLTRGIGSNTEIIPSNRLRCQHCDSRVDASCADPDIKNRNEILPCKRFVQPESCIKIEMNGSSEFIYFLN